MVRSALLILTIGHSVHSLERFLELLQRHGVQVVIDVRSVPFSGRVPQFNRPVLEKRLPKAGVAYVFEGDALGARPTSATMYENGRVSFARVEASVPFKEAIARVITRSRAERVVLMCSEQEPLECPRFLLAGRVLSSASVPVSHILADGTLDAHAEVERRLLRLTGQAEPDLFASPSAILARAYGIQEEKVAFRGPGPSPTDDLE